MYIAADDDGNNRRLASSSGIPTGGGHYDIGWHTDSCETVEVTLNDNYEGGRLLHLNLDGVHRTDTRTGTAIGE